MMKYTVTNYNLTHLVSFEVTRYPRSKSKKIEIIIGGEPRPSNIAEVLEISRAVDELKKDLRIK